MALLYLMLLVGMISSALIFAALLDGFNYVGLFRLFRVLRWSR